MLSGSLCLTQSCGGNLTSSFLLKAQPLKTLFPARISALWLLVLCSLLPQISWHYSQNLKSSCYNLGWLLCHSVSNWVFGDFYSLFNPLQYSCLENSMDGGSWQATVRVVTKSRTRLSNFTFTFHSLFLRHLFTYLSRTLYCLAPFSFFWFTLILVPHILHQLPQEEKVNKGEFLRPWIFGNILIQQEYLMEQLSWHGMLDICL